MKFFEGDEGYAIVRVPEEFANAIDSASGSDFIGSVIVNSDKSVGLNVKIIISDRGQGPHRQCEEVIQNGFER